MKKLKINKIARSVATAFLMLTSIVSTVASASGGNEIKLTSDKNFAQPGDSINIKASLEPDKTGVAGFTIDLHYDPSKVTVYVPSEAESYLIFCNSLFAETSHVTALRKSTPNEQTALRSCELDL